MRKLECEIRYGSIYEVSFVSWYNFWWYPDSTSWSSLPQISWLHLQPYLSQLEFQEEHHHLFWFLWLCKTSHWYFECGPKQGFCHFHQYGSDFFCFFSIKWCPSIHNSCVIVTWWLSIVSPDIEFFKRKHSHGMASDILQLFSDIFN